MVSIMDCETPSHQVARQQQQQQQEQQQQQDEQVEKCHTRPPLSAVSQRSIELQISSPPTKNLEQELIKRSLKLDLNLIDNATKQLEQFSIKSPKSPLITTIRQGKLPHQTSLTSQADLVEDRKTLRDALYQGIFHRHRRTIFAIGSFLRMLKSRTSQYNTIRSSSEGEDIDESR